MSTNKCTHNSSEKHPLSYWDKMKHIQLVGSYFFLTLNSPSVLQVNTNLFHTTTSAQGAAGLAEVILIPRCHGSRSSNTVKIVQAAIIGQLSERWKTAGKGSNIRVKTRQRSCVQDVKFIEENWCPKSRCCYTMIKKQEGNMNEQQNQQLKER